MTYRERVTPDSSLTGQVAAGARVREANIRHREEWATIRSELDKWWRGRGSMLVTQVVACSYSYVESSENGPTVSQGVSVVCNWWLTPAVYAGVSVVLLEARLRRAALRGKKLIFSGSLIFKLLLGGGAFGFSALLFQQGRQSEWWVNLLGAGFVVAFLLGWPKTIVTDERGVECHWWWRRKVFIPWDEVEYAETGKVGSIQIVGTNARITFEGYNADPDRFSKVLTTRSKVKKIAVPGEFTGLHL